MHPLVVIVLAKGHAAPLRSFANFYFYFPNTVN